MMEPEVHTWQTGPILHVSVLVFERPMPTQGALGAAWRYTQQGNKYRAWRNRQRDILKAALAEYAHLPFPETWTVGAAFGFGAMLASPPNARRRKDGQPDGRTATSVWSWDLRNLEKAVEDVCNGILWHDDRQVRFGGPSAAIDTASDWWCIHAWACEHPFGSGHPFGKDGKVQMDWDDKWSVHSAPSLVKVE